MEQILKPTLTLTSSLEDDKSTRGLWRSSSKEKETNMDKGKVDEADNTKEDILQRFRKDSDSDSVESDESMTPEKHVPASMYDNEFDVHQAQRDRIFDQYNEDNQPEKKSKTKPFRIAQQLKSGLKALFSKKEKRKQTDTGEDSVGEQLEAQVQTYLQYAVSAVSEKNKQYICFVVRRLSRINKNYILWCHHAV